MRIKILPILIALMMLGTAGLFGYAHNNPNGPLGALDFQIVPLSNSPNGGGPLYASGGFGNLSGSNIGKLTYTVEPVQGTYQYNGRPYIASSITSDGTSSNFDLLVNGNITIYEFAVSDSSYVKFTTTFYTNITINGQFIDYYSESYTYNDASFISGTVTQPFSLQIVPTTSITGAYNNIMTFSIHSVTTANPTGGWGLFASGSFHTLKTSTQRQVYVLPATITLSQPKTPIKQGTAEDIYYTTGYAPANANGQAYALEIFGSQAYNGGTLLKTVLLGQNIGNGEYTYNVPNNAFVQSSQPNANQFKVELLDINVGSFPLVEKTFFTIDNYSYEPGTPTITVLNPPSNGQYYAGQTVNLQINYTINSITKTPIKYIDVWVYSAISSNQPAEYIINDVPYKTSTSGNGSIDVSFQLPDNPNSLYVSAIAVDNNGLSSKMATFDISSYDIHTTKKLASPINLLEVIGFVIAMIVGSILIYLYAPTDELSKIIIIIGWVGAILILLVSYVPGVI